MRKLLISLFALLFVAGVAYAGTICDPSAGPCREVTSYYNSSSSTTLTAGMVVIWDTDDSTGDNDNYVDVTTTSGTGPVAGIVLVGAAVGADGIMVTDGVTTVTVPSSGVGSDIVAGTFLCTSGTAGTARSCPSSGVDKGLQFGYATATASGGSVLANIDCE